MTSTASLIIGVDSTSAKKATQDLDKLTKQSKTTETQAQKSALAAVKLAQAEQRLGTESAKTALAQHRLAAAEAKAAAEAQKAALASERAARATATLGAKSSGSATALAGFSRALAAVGGAYGVARVVGGYVALADQAANLNSRLKLATGSQEAFNTAQRETFAIAQRTSTELEPVVNLFARLSLNTRELGISQGELLQITESITQSYAVSGASAAETAGSIRQLTQAMASGVLRGEEFNSIMENSPRLAQALADGLQVPIGALRAMSQEGELTADKVIAALRSQSAVLQTEYDRMPLTVARATQQLQNSILKLVSDEETAEGATADLAKAVKGLADELGSENTKSGFASIVGFIGDLVSAVSTAANLFGVFEASVTATFDSIAARRRLIGQILSLEGHENGGAGIKEAQAELKAIELAATQAWIKQRRAMGLDSSVLPPPPKPIQWSDPAKPLPRVMRDGETETIRAGYEGWDTQGAIDKAAAEARRKKAEADRLAAEAASDYASATDTLNQALDAQAERIGGPLVAATNDYRDQMLELSAVESELVRLGKLDADAVEKLRIGRELLTEQFMKETDEINARKTPAEQLIDDMEFELSLIGMTNDARQTAIDLRNLEGKATAEQADAIAQLNKDREKIIEETGIADEMRESLSDSIMMAFKDGDVLGAASSFIESIAAAMQRRLADSIADSLLGAPGTQSGGGIFGSIMGFLGLGGGGSGGFSSAAASASASFGDSLMGFAKGTDFAPGGMAWVGEKGPELVNLPRGSQVIPADKSARMGGNTITINIAGHATKETAQQIASKVAQQMAFAGRAR